MQARCKPRMVKRFSEKLGNKEKRRETSPLLSFTTLNQLVLGSSPSRGTILQYNGAPLLLLTHVGASRAVGA